MDMPLHPSSLEVRRLSEELRLRLEVSSPVDDSVVVSGAGAVVTSATLRKAPSQLARR